MKCGKCNNCGKFRKARDLKWVSTAIDDGYDVCCWCRPDLFQRTIGDSIRIHGWAKPQ